MRVYRVSRVLAAQPTGEAFERPEGFDLAAFWEGWRAQFEESLRRYPAKVRVAPECLPHLPQALGPHASTAPGGGGAPDAEGWVALPLVFESLEIARSSLLALGPIVEVLEPPELRDAVREAAAGVRALYAP
jgi:predicted DNA-binding transcriptional regulator YafY